MSHSRTSEDLFNLLHSLGQAEKRYFKVFVKKTSKRAHNSILLFDAILKQRVYDEAALKQTFADTPIAAHFSSEKVYLQRLVMKSLRAYHAEASEEGKLKDLLHDAMILRERSLFGMSRKAITKAKSKARNLESWTVLCEALEFERTLIKETASKGVAEELSANLEERLEAMERLKEEHHFTTIYDRLFLEVRSRVIMRSPEMLHAAQRWFQDHQMDHIDQPRSIRSKLYFHFSHALYHQLTGNPSLSHHAYQQVIEVWDAHPQAIRNNRVRYLRTLCNFLGSCHINDQLADFPPVLAKAQAFTADTPQLKMEHFKGVVYYELLYYLAIGKFEQGRELARNIEEGLDRFGPQINQARIFGFRYNLCILYFALEDFKSSLRWLNRILNGPRTEQRQDIQQVARIMQMILHFELGNVELLDSLLRSTYRYLHGRGSWEGFEKMVSDSLRRAVGLVDPKKLQKEFDALYRKLIDFRKTEKQVPGLRELIYWLEYKIEGIPLREVVIRGMKN